MPRVPIALRIERLVSRTVFVACLVLVRRIRFERVRTFGAWLGAVQFTLGFAARRRMVNELAALLGHRPDDPVVQAQMREAYRSNVAAALEMLKMLDRRQDEALLLSRVEVEGLGELETALAPGRGAILLASHAGNGALLVLKLVAAGVPVSVVYRESRMFDPGFFERGLSFYGVEGIPATEGLKAYGKMLAALRQNRVVYLMADQGTKKARDGMVVRFLGKDMPMPAGPAQLARHARAPLLPVATTGADPAWRFEILPPIRREPDSTLEDDVRAQFGVSERLILRNPQWWSWPHRRWKRFPLAIGAAAERKSVSDPEPTADP